MSRSAWKETREVRHACPKTGSIQPRRRLIGIWECKFVLIWNVSGCQLWDVARTVDAKEYERHFM